VTYARLWGGLLFAALSAAHASEIAPGLSNKTPSETYDGIGAVYTTADRMEQFRFEEYESEFRYVPSAGSAHEPTIGVTTYDTPPTSTVKSCSDASFRCVAIGLEAFAVPRRHLTPSDKYVAYGSSFSVAKCLRGYDDVCQVALIKAECYYNRIKKGCAPTAAERTGDDASGILYFIYNEDFGVTAYGFAPLTGEPVSTDEMLAAAKSRLLIGDHGVLKPQR
jgi:hypothetical protein